MRARQQGAGLLIPVLLVITVAAFAVIVAASQSGGDIQGSDANADGQQAMLLAETGVERALKRFATGTACGGALTEAITDLSTIGLGTTAYRINISAGLATDFAGAALPATQCRMPVTGTVLASNVSRTIHAIVDRNLLSGPNNHTFDNPTTAGVPSGWTLLPASPPAPANHAMTGGPNCSRSIWLVKPRTNNYQLRSEGNITAPTNFTVTAASVTTITFQYRLNDRGSNVGCAGGGASGGPAWDCPAAGANDGRFCFAHLGAGGPWYSTTFDSNPTNMGNVACPGGTDAGGITIFAPCNTGYATGTVTTTMPAGGPFTITGFTYHLRLQQGRRKEVFLDQIQATNDTAIGAARVQVWRDCSTAADPANCV